MLMELIQMPKDAQPPIRFINGRVDPNALFDQLHELSESGALKRALEKRNRVLYSETTNGTITQTISRNYTPKN